MNENAPQQEVPCSIASVQSDTPIESASASTANQENSSKIAYAATGIVLGGIAILGFAIILLLFSAASSWAGSSYSYIIDPQEDAPNGFDPFADEDQDAEDWLYYFDDSYVG